MEHESTACSSLGQWMQHQLRRSISSGTISGPDEGSFGSMLEISWKGTKPVQLSDGTERKFINDNDTIIMKGHGEKNGVKVGFGEVSTKILPAKH